MVTMPSRSADTEEARATKERAALLFIEQFRNRNGDRPNEGNGDEYGVPDGGPRYKAYMLGNFRNIRQDKEHLSEEQITELAIVIGYYEMVCRVLESLQVETESEEFKGIG